MIKNWIEFLISAVTLVSGFHVMLRIARGGNTKKTLYGYFLYMFLLIVVLVVLCFIV